MISKRGNEFHHNDWFLSETASYTPYSHCGNTCTGVWSLCIFMCTFISILVCIIDDFYRVTLTDKSIVLRICKRICQWICNYFMCLKFLVFTCKSSEHILPCNVFEYANEYAKTSHPSHALQIFDRNRGSHRGSIIVSDCICEKDEPAYMLIYILL